MSDEASELDEIDFNSELESTETISNFSFSPPRNQDAIINNFDVPVRTNIVQNLFRREIGYGCLKPTGQTVLRSFHLTSIFPSQILLSHVFMGMTKCGRFLITYTVTTDQDDDEWYATVYKYRLHWWSFKPGSQVRKIAEVSLFGNHKIVAPIQMYICQWPQDFEKILVYGLIKECGNIDVSAPTINQHAFVTVTALPSINNCQDCRVVASSYMLDDIAASWDTCLRFSCLKHGYTVHTSFDVVVPYPEFVPKISLKCSDYAVFNANNFLYAIRINLSNCDKKTRDAADHEDLPYDLIGESCEETKAAEEPSCSENDQTHAGEDKRPLKLKEQIIRDFSEEVNSVGSRRADASGERNEAGQADPNETPARFTGVEDVIRCRRGEYLTSPPLPTRVAHFRVGETDRKSSASCQETESRPKEESSENDHFRCPKSSNFIKRPKSEMRKTNGFESYKSESSKKCYKSFFTRHKVPRNNLNFGMLIRSNGFAKPVLKAVKPVAEADIHSGMEGRHRLRGSDADATYEFVDDAQHEVEKLSQFRKKRLADKKYEFQDFDSENIVPFSTVRQENTLKSPRKSAEAEGDVERAMSVNVELRFGGEVSGAEKTEMMLRSPSPMYSLDLSISVPSPRSPLILEILSSPTQHEGVLRPFNRNTSSNQLLSPIAKYLASPPNAQKPAKQKEYMKSKGCDDSKNSTKQGANKISTNLETRFILENGILINDLSERYFKDGIGHHFDLDVYRNLIRNTSKFHGESIRFERRFVEVDDELVSVITDIEDDDMSAVTGYHTALNVEVHGAGYSQLQMISNSKAEKLSAPCVVIDQQSLDIEGICHSVATTLCHVSNKTFTFCNDYDIEILDVCPRSGDVLVLLMMRIEGSEGIRDEVSQLEQYEASVTLVWNLHSGAYKVCMVVPPQKVNWVWDSKAIWNPAREASKKFRMQLPSDVTLCEPSVKVYTNNSTLRGISLLRIQDPENGIQFVL
ncbi:UNVERIFIED_CONTAM: hypothetical protein PYX00_003083 [Menopon gallinae]|uniref:DDB1- and CUL4-associated factor 15 WD40 repeat-containing domain-containing protein n=1 Tax=Menopon gallinae TaxID=328185 RepID=A0AAW2HZD4_9NEOP